MKTKILILAGLTVLSAAAVTRQEALDFLYGAMSLPDKADYPAEFYERNVDASLLAREEMPWGKIVPDREFMHFVLPVRVNNENLDMSRPEFYAELKDRVKDLTMEEAILEVNHWCHEKATYRPSDGRTSSPLSTVSQAIGRCGEESTFAVAALRSVGIPARQIYTPRWAHTDDNHAWVEAWADGKWHFIGACEPEPVLDLAWFNAPAARGLLMSTNVTGQYYGPEEVLLRQPLTTRINVTSNYAPVDTISVRIVDKAGKVVPGAKVNFCIYNYADFFPAVSKTADREGRASLVAGIGDMVIWATDGKRYGFSKGRAGSPQTESAEGAPCTERNTTTIDIVLDRDCDWEGMDDLDIIPPVARASMPAVSAETRAENDRRFVREDSIRGAYTATFADSLSIAGLARELKIDEGKLQKILGESRGNHKNLENCLRAMTAADRAEAVELLLAVTEKDRRDIPTEVIVDHVANAVGRKAAKVADDIYTNYILSPRIEAEGLRPWRSGLKVKLPVKKGDVNKLIDWINKNISIDNSVNPQNLRMSPEAVIRERRADKRSAGIFFVAAARTLGMPARIDPVTGDTQYLGKDGKWVKVVFESERRPEDRPTSIPGTLKLEFEPQGHIVDPKYYSQFSVLRIIDGVPQQLDFDEDGTVGTIFAEPVELEAGQYMVITGQRMADGGVLARSETFIIRPGEDVVRKLQIRNDDSQLSVIGSLNAENIYHDLSTGTDKSLLFTTGRGYYVLGLIQPNHEPSAHALNDIIATATELEKIGAKIMLLFDSKEAAERWNKAAFVGLPSNVVIGIDTDSTSRNELAASLHLESIDYPIFVVADTFNRVVWESTGYTIGMGEKLLKVFSRL